MPPLGVSNDVLIEIFRFCTYNDLNALALTSRQLQAIQLDNAPIARMHCLEVSSQGFTLHYSPNSPRKRLFPSFDEFADCARKVRPKIHIMELVNEYFSEVEDCFLRKVFTAEVYRIRTNIVDPMLHLRFYCKGVMYESLWGHAEVCEHKEDRDTLLHQCHTLTIECFEDTKWVDWNTRLLAQNELQEIVYTFLVSEGYPNDL